MSIGAATPLIVSGAPRSGTSLLYNLFDQHPDVSWLVEEGFLFEYLHDLGRDGLAVWLDSMPSDPDALIAGLRDKQIIPPAHVTYIQSKERGSVSEVEIRAPWDEAMFRAAIAAPFARDIPGVWRHLVGALLAGLGQPARRYACLKSPDYAKSTSSALDLVPAARAVVIVRDPLFALDSLKRSREMRGAKLMTWPLLAQAVRSFQQMHARIEAADQRRFRAVRYETLIAQPDTVMRELAAWLDIPFSPTLLQPTMHGQRWPGISSFRKTEGIETAPSERGIQSLTAEEQSLIRRHLADLRLRFGYA
jgi:hypothetical protein